MRKKIFEQRLARINDKISKLKARGLASEDVNEVRAINEQIEDLQHSSLSAVNSLNQVLAENERLREQAAALEEQLQQKTQTHQSEKTSLLQTIEAREKALKAMDWFWQIDEAYVRGRYTLCRKLIASLDEAKLMEFLPRESITENERFSPYDRLAEIREAVN